MSNAGQLACMGVLADGVRPLTDVERTDLANERRSLAWRAALLAFSVPLAIVAGLGFALIAFALLPAAYKALATIPSVAAIFGDALLALKALDTIRRRSRVAAALRCGEVVRFEGRPRAAVPQNTRILLAREGFPVDGALSVPFEVLLRTGRLWSVDGKRSRTWLMLPLQRPAAVPAQAAIAANWVKPVASNGQGTVFVGTRPLSDEELDEIGALQKRVLPGMLSYVAWAAFMLLLFGSRALHGGAGWRLTGSAVSAFVLMVMGRDVLPKLRMLQRLSRDRASGVVQIVRARFTKAEELSPPMELLPLSRIAWSQGQQPAPWRRGSGDATRPG